MPCRHILFLLDAPVGKKTQMLIPSLSRQSLTNISEDLEEEAVEVICSALSDEQLDYSQDSKFIRFLVQGLVKGDAYLEDQEVLSVSDLCSYLQRLVLDESGGSQTVSYEKLGFGKGKFHFSKTPASSTQTDSLTTSPTSNFPIKPVESISERLLTSTHQRDPEDLLTMLEEKERLAEAEPLFAVLWSAPLGSPQELIDDEREVILETLSGSGKRVQARLDYATEPAIRRLVTAEIPQVIHFSDFSPRRNDNLIVIEDNQGGTQKLNVTEFAQLYVQGLFSFNDHPDAYMMNHPETSNNYMDLPKVAIVVGENADTIASAFLQINIKYVISLKTLTLTSRSVVHTFLAEFYSHILNNTSVFQAFQKAFSVSEEEFGIRDSITSLSELFTFLPLDNSDEPICDIVEGSLELVNPPRTVDNLPSSSYCFIPRQDTKKIVSALLDPNIRVCYAHGSVGCGKTTVGIQAAKFLATRQHFVDGVLWLDLLNQRFNQFIFSLGRVLQINNNNQEDLISKLSILQHEALLVLDHADGNQFYKKPLFQEFLKELISTTRNIKVLLIGSSPPQCPLEFSTVVQVAELSIEESSALLTSLAPPLTEQAKEISRLLENNPLALQMLSSLISHPNYSQLTAQQLLSILKPTSHESWAIEPSLPFEVPPHSQFEDPSPIGVDYAPTFRSYSSEIDIQPPSSGPPPRPQNNRSTFRERHSISHPPTFPTSEESLSSPPDRQIIYSPSSQSSSSSHSLPNPQLTSSAHSLPAHWYSSPEPSPRYYSEVNSSPPPLQSESRAVSESTLVKKPSQKAETQANSKKKMKKKVGADPPKEKKRRRSQQFSSESMEESSEISTKPFEILSDTSSATSGSEPQQEYAAVSSRARDSSKSERIALSSSSGQDERRRSPSSNSEKYSIGKKDQIQSRTGSIPSGWLTSGNFSSNYGTPEFPLRQPIVSPKKKESPSQDNPILKPRKLSSGTNQLLRASESYKASQFALSFPKVIELSLNALPASKVPPLLALTLFPAQFTLEAAINLFDAERNVTRKLLKLYQQLNLVIFSSSGYLMHELIRECLSQKRDREYPSDFMKVYQARFIEYYKNLLLTCNRYYDQGNQTGTNIFDKEHHNFELALQLSKQCFPIQYIEIALAGRNIFSARYNSQERVTIYSNCLSLAEEERLQTFNSAIRIQLGQALERTGEFSNAMNQYQIALDSIRNEKGEKNDDAATILKNIGLLYANHYYKKNNLQTAQEYLQKALDLRKDLLGLQHPETAQSFSHMATLKRRLREYSEAERLYKMALEILQKALGKNNVSVARVISNLGKLYSLIGKPDESESYYLKAIRIWRKLKHPDLCNSLINLATLYTDQQKYVNAELLLREAYELRQHESPLDLATVLSKLGQVLVKQDKTDKAVLSLEESLDLRYSHSGKDHFLFQQDLTTLRKTLEKNNDFQGVKRLERKFELAKPVPKKYKSHFPRKNNPEKFRNKIWTNNSQEDMQSPPSYNTTFQHYPNRNSNNFNSNNNNNNNSNNNNNNFSRSWNQSRLKSPSLSRRKPSPPKKGHPSSNKKQ